MYHPPCLVSVVIVTVCKVDWYAYCLDSLVRCCAIVHLSALKCVIFASVTRSLDFQKYAIEDPLWPVDWVIRLQIFLNISCCWALTPSSPPLSTTKGSKIHGQSNLSALRASHGWHCSSCKFSGVGHANPTVPHNSYQCFVQHSDSTCGCICAATFQTVA